MNGNADARPADDAPMYDRAAAKFNGDFFFIDTYSGYYGSVRDPKGKHHVLPAEASDHDLGAAILDCLAHSRVVKPTEAPDLDVDRDVMAQRYEQRVLALMQHCGYKTRRALFRNMLSCGINRWRDSGAMTIDPSNHYRLEGWDGEGIEKEDDVVLGSDSTPEQVGAALRLAFSRCIDSFGRKRPPPREVKRVLPPSWWKAPGSLQERWLRCATDADAAALAAVMPLWEPDAYGLDVQVQDRLQALGHGLYADWKDTGAAAQSLEKMADARGLGGYVDWRAQQDPDDNAPQDAMLAAADRWFSARGYRIVDMRTDSDDYAAVAVRTEALPDFVAWCGELGINAAPAADRYGDSGSA